MIIRYVPEIEVDVILHVYHTSSVGGHHSRVHETIKVLQYGYYLPKLCQDANSLVRKCVQCQKQGGITQRYELPLKVELFDLWGIDFMGLFVSLYCNKFILVAMDYISK